jgi:hypothetical protein
LVTGELFLEGDYTERIDAEGYSFFKLRVAESSD